MSLGGTGKSNAYRAAIQNSVAQGVVYVVSSGNDFNDIYGDSTYNNGNDYLPASYPEVMTISALVDTDGKPGGTGSSTNYGTDDSYASFSNYSNVRSSFDAAMADSALPQSLKDLKDSLGLGIDLVLPGVNILSTFPNGSYAYESGTSMASPHATGLVALYIAQHGPAHDAGGVYAIHEALIRDGVSQTDPNNGLATPEPYNQEPIGWAGTQQNVTDIAVASVSAPSSVVAGELVSVNVTVTNQGNQDVSSFKVTLTADTTTTIDPQTVGLAAGASRTLTFSWDTSGASNGDHTLTASIGLSDDDATNNSAGTVVSVVATSPTAPTGLAAVAVSSSQIDLTWTDNSDNEDGVRIERSTDGTIWSEIATVGADVTSYSDTGLAPATTYNYRVVAFNIKGDSGPSNVVDATTNAAPVVNVPEHFNDSNLPGWTFLNGIWAHANEAGNGLLKQTSTTSTTNGELRKALWTGISGSPTEIVARVRIDDWRDGEYARAGVSLLNDANGAGYDLVITGRHDDGQGRWKNQSLMTLEFVDGYALQWSGYNNGPSVQGQWNIGAWYNFHMRADNGTLYGNVWPDGSSEPTGWMIAYTPQSNVSQAAGVPGLIGGASGVWNNRQGPSYAAASFDDIALPGYTASATSAGFAAASNGVPAGVLIPLVPGAVGFDLETSLDDLARELVGGTRRRR